MRGSKALPARDAFYRFLAHPNYNWRKLLHAVSAAMIGELNTLTGKTNNRVLIIDESPYKRSRSKAVSYSAGIMITAITAITAIIGGIAC